MIYELSEFFCLFYMLTKVLGLKWPYDFSFYQSIKHKINKYFQRFSVVFYFFAHHYTRMPIARPSNFIFKGVRFMDRKFIPRNLILIIF
jgi:hypothetical protein